MPASRRSSALVTAFLFVLLVGLMAHGAEKGEVTLTLPMGDPVAGREAFLALSCTSCHRVAGETGLPEPVSATPGPTLGRYEGKQGAAAVGMSIFAPSHDITATIPQPREDDLSPMPDFTRAMTVRQFLDIIAYLTSLDEGK